ncbi:hypothetical protein [Sphingobacterium suaedae]|uniref:Energy transducer TonB n=1 Tax=Sphingobacterium suaedae TaxID=1686402 RepID=A0ABW5KKA9_9SPHI
MNDNQFDKLFRDRLANGEENPPLHVWKNIDTQLDRKRGVTLKTSYWTRYAAALAIFVLAGILTYRALQLENKVSATHVTIPQEQRTDERPVSAPLKKERIAINEPPIPNAAIQRTASIKGARKIKTTSTRKSGDVDEPNLPEVSLASLSLRKNTDSIPAKLPTRRVVEAAPIQPLIDNPEEEETMVAALPPSAGGLVPNLLNKISDVLNPDDNKTIHFSKDDEGSFRIDIYHSLVKNRRKKK